MTSQKKVTIYTDGSCIGNPGPGGYGVVIQYGTHRKELSGGYRMTTNNRMEVTAAIKALEALKEPCEAQLFSDSAYLVNAMTKGWARSWKAKGWRRPRNATVENVNLWEELLLLCDKHKVRFCWVEGHAGIEDNERCDKLALTAAKLTNLPEDTGYKPVKIENSHGE